jgi:hypothetical protein
MFPLIPLLFTGVGKDVIGNVGSAVGGAFDGINLGGSSTNNSEQIYLAQLAEEKRRKENTIIILSSIALVAIIGGIIWYRARK